MERIIARTALSILLTVFYLPFAAALSVGQVDDFEDGTTMNWGVAGLGAIHPNPPDNVAGGGPGGATDNYLLLTSQGGMGPSSRMTAFNFFGQWAGDYTATGVTSIEMDLRNFGSNDLHLRLMIGATDTMGNLLHDAFTTESVFLPRGTNWQSVSFDISSSDLELARMGNVEDALAGATFLRIFHNEAAAFPPANGIIASLSLDNIRAVGSPVPIPPALYLFVAGAAALIRIGRRDKV